MSQLFVLPVLTRKFGLVRLFQKVLFITIFVYMSQGIIRTLYSVPDLNGQVDTKFWVWVGLLTSLTFKTICHTILFTGSTILINNACPRVESLGAVNGFSTCKIFFFLLCNVPYTDFCKRLRKCYSSCRSRYLWCHLVHVSDHS